MNPRNTSLNLAVLVILAAIASTGYGADRALLVGINEYQKVQPLRGPRNDVSAMETFIQQVWRYPAGSIKTLVDQQATRAAILAAFDEWLIQGTRPGDRVLFFFAGHGYRMADQPGGDEQDQHDETLVATDTLRDPITGQFKNMIRDDEINARLQRLGDRRVMVVLDSCHSGTATRHLAPQSSPLARSPVFANVPEQDFRQFPTRRLLAHQQEAGFVDARPGLIAFSAVAANQKALEDIEDPQRVMGVFTKRFIRGIRDYQADASGDRRITYAELLEYLRKDSAAYCKRSQNDCRLGLSPQLEAHHSVLSQDVRGVPVRLTPPESLLAHSNEAGLRLDISPGSQVRLEDEMTFRISSQRPGQLLLFDFNADNKLSQIFPNEYSQQRQDRYDGRIRANAIIAIPDDYYPFKFQVFPPLGPGKVVAVLIEDPVNTRDLVVVSKPYASIPDPQDWLARLRQRLNQPWHEADGRNRDVRWSVTWTDYEVTR